LLQFGAARDDDVAGARSHLPVIEENNGSIGWFIRS
jgi:hypothetical protein